MARVRRTREEMAHIRERLVALALEHRPCSVRQVFYAAVSEGLVEKTEQAYRNTVSRLLADAREDGGLPWSVIVDHTRSAYRTYTVGGLRDALEETRRLYRRALWSNQPRRVEVWTEARTLMGALKPVAAKWDVPLFPCGGYPSRTFLHDAAEDIGLAGKPTTVLYLGDHDPSGRDIERNVIEGLRRYAPAGSDIHLERLAVMPEQVAALGLPERPPKASDSRSRGFSGGCVEVEAIPPGDIRALVDDAIEALVEPHELERVRVAEESERRILDLFADGCWRSGADEAAGYEDAVAAGAVDAADRRYIEQVR